MDYLAKVQNYGCVWRTEYNEERPHSSLGYLTPNEYAAQETEKDSGGLRYFNEESYQFLKHSRQTPAEQPPSGWISFLISRRILRINPTRSINAAFFTKHRLLYQFCNDVADQNVTFLYAGRLS